MRAFRWVVVLAGLLAPALATYAAAPVPGGLGSGSTQHQPEKRPVRLLASDASGLTLEMSFAAPGIEPLEEPAGRVRVTMDRSVPSNRLGYPELPVERFTIGVPHGAAVRARATPGPVKQFGRFRVVPTPTANIKSHASGTQYAEPRFLEDREAYGARGFHPASLVEVVSDGLTRDRRTVTVEVRPVQYDASSRRLRAYSRITVRVDFVGGQTSRRAGSRESAPFAEYFARHLLNDQVANVWRAPAAPTQDTDGVVAPPPPMAVKLFVSSEAVIRVDGRALAAQGIDISQVAPRNLAVTFRGAEQPIYVHGSRDGRFDMDDYVEFLATRPTTPYSRYSVYHLSEQASPGLRVSEPEGAPRESLATLVPNFRSKVHLEQDLEHSLLQTVTTSAVSPGDPHEWYEARDHWFWFGVKNGVERNEAALEFPVYDVARTFDLGRIDVMLQGGTPVDHDVILSLNEVKLGRARWEDQQEEVIGRSVRIEDLVDAADGMNTMRMVRVDTNEDDDTDKYPFRAYVNWFDLEYTRDFRAVGDLLFASTPPSNKPLANRRLRTLEYSISDFVGSDVAVYEHNGANLVSRFRNVEVRRVAVTDEARDRMHGIQARTGEPFSTPTSLHTVRFQAEDTHDAQYIALTSGGASAPDRIELDTPSSLRSTTNGADYIVLYHRAFEEAALRLAEWRATPKGGGLRVKAVEVGDVYDEFGHGMTSPWAIKDFLRYAYVNWRAPALTYVTILADGTYDMYGVDEELYPEAPDVMGFIPTHYVWTLFGQTASDHWYTTVSGIDPLPDFFLGRLPVEHPEEANASVNKIIAYEGSPRNGSWRRQIISVADDDTTSSGDFIFRKSLEEVSQNHTLLGYVTNKIFLEDIFDEFPDEADTSRVRRASQLARQRIVDSLSEGALIAQYAGHGGRLVWAHEIIFDNSGIRTLRPTDRLSLMFVLSCNNGYFDAPAEPSMGELMLRLEDAGIIGMLAATRLTFGSGNDALNKLLFDDIFGRNVRSFGEIAFHPKTRLMVEQGLTHLEVMQQYSLFGDPATKLHIADYEIRPGIANRSVTPGGAINTQPGQILASVYDRATDAKTFTPVADFNGRLFVTAQFTQRGGGVIERAAEAAVTAGRYPGVSLDVPANAEPGRAQIEFYAESTEHIAVGGATFALSDPVIEDVIVEDRGDGVGVAVRVTDDRGIDRIEFEYYDNVAREWVITPMQRDAARGAGWYSLAQDLPMPAPGEAFEYIARAVDTDGTEVKTRVATQVFHPLPDWRVLRSDTDRKPLITYQFNEALGWHISVTLENVEDVRTTVPVPVAIYDGNPDLDDDDTPDATAELLGELMVMPDSWIKGDPLAPAASDDTRLRESDTPLNTHWLGTGTLRTTLDTGQHVLFAWIDPPSDDGTGTLEESDRRDNVDAVETLVAEVRVQGAGVALESVDRGLRIDISGRAYSAPRVVGLAGVDPAPVGQPSLTALPAIGAAAHSVAAVSGEASETLAAAATVEARFDLTAFRQQLQSRIGGEGDAPAIPPEVVRNELATAGIYEWLGDIERWRRLPDTALLADAQQNLVTRPGFTTPTRAPFEPNAAAVVADGANAEAGRWVALFTDPFNYDLYVQDEDGTLTRKAERVPMVLSGAALPSERNTLPHIVTATNEPVRAYGDVLRMDVALAGQGVPDPPGPARRGNSGRGVVQLLDAGSAPEDEWCLLFLNATQYEVRRRSWDAKSTRPDTVVVTVGQAWTDPDSGVRLRVLAGASLLGPGDSFVFASHELGVTRATTERLGTFAPFVTTDITAPAVEFAVAGQDFADGDPVAPAPEFHATITDDSGVHPEDVTLEISADGGEFVAVEPENLRTHIAPGTSQLVLNYTPKLDPADYALRATALDLDGNRAVREIGFRVTSTSILRSVLNYPNPFRTITDIGIEATGEMESLAVTVYSLQGRVVWRADHPRTAGFVRVRWDGRDTEGRDVANGVYYAKVVMTARGETHTDVLKMLKLK